MADEITADELDEMIDETKANPELPKTFSTGVPTIETQSLPSETSDTAVSMPEPMSRTEEARLSIAEERGRLASTQTTDIINPIAYQQLKQVATDMFNSKAFPKSIENPLQALMLMQAGSEMGMKPMQSVNSLYIVNGQVNIWGKAVISRMTNAGYFIQYQDGEDKCTAIVVRDLQPSTGRPLAEKYEETVTFEEAEKSGYTKTMGGSLKPGWLPGMNRRLKLRYQALSLILKTYLPHLLGSTAGIVEVNEDWEPKNYEIEVGGKTLPRPGGVVKVPDVTKTIDQKGVASEIMEKIKDETDH